MSKGSQDGVIRGAIVRRIDQLGRVVANMRANIVCFGEAMLRHSTNPSGKEKITPGGAEYNVACALAQLDNDVKWVTSLPNNADAEVITSPAHLRGVKLQIVNSEKQVGRYFVDNRAKTVVYNRDESAFANLKSSDIDWRTTLAGCRWLVASGITPLLSEGAHDNWSQALTFAEIDGTLVALDVNHREGLAPFDKLWNLLKPKLRQVHLLVVSTEVLSRLTGGDSVDHLARLREKWNLPYIACTWKKPMGGGMARWSGVAHARGIEHTREEAVHHTPVEPLGGGDAWLGALLDGLVSGMELHRCIRRADIFAALTQQTFGDLGEIDSEEISEWESQIGEIHL